MLEIKRIPTNNNLIIDTTLVSVILPPKLIDIDIYTDSTNKYLDITKLVQVPYRLSSYKGYQDKQSIFIDHNKPIQRKLINKHSKDNVIVLEYEDIYISVSANQYNSKLDKLIIPDNILIDNTYNSKLVIFIKEDK